VEPLPPVIFLLVMTRDLHAAPYIGSRMTKHPAVLARYSSCGWTGFLHDAKWCNQSEQGASGKIEGIVGQYGGGLFQLHTTINFFTLFLQARSIALCWTVFIIFWVHWKVTTYSSYRKLDSCVLTSKLGREMWKLNCNRHHLVPLYPP